jgi:hypothetical protein
VVVVACIEKRMPCPYKKSCGFPQLNYYYITNPAIKAAATATKAKKHYGKTGVQRPLYGML